MTTIWVLDRTKVLHGRQTQTGFAKKSHKSPSIKKDDNNINYKTAEKGSNYI